MVFRYMGSEIFLIIMIPITAPSTTTGTRVRSKRTVWGVMFYQIKISIGSIR